MSQLRDPGLQPERTRLAWQRTALAMGVCTVLQAREALTSEAALSLATAAGLGLATAGLVMMGAIRVRQLRTSHQKAPHSLLVKVVLACGVLASMSAAWTML